MSYPFKFDLGKTIQAVGVLLEPEHGRRMAYIRVLKLLYIADRESLKETHRPITGDNPIAMKNGPLLEGTYKLIRGLHLAFPQWSKFFQKEHYQIAMLENPGVDRLAPYDIEKLQEVARRYEDLDDWELVDLVHEFEEWKKNVRGTSSSHIPLEDIMTGVGCADATADALAEAAEDDAADRLFGSLTQ